MTSLRAKSRVIARATLKGLRRERDMATFLGLEMINALGLCGSYASRPARRDLSLAA